MPCAAAQHQRARAAEGSRSTRSRAGRMESLEGPKEVYTTRTFLRVSVNWRAIVL